MVRLIVPAILFNSSSIVSIIASAFGTSAFLSRICARYSSTPISPGPNRTVSPSPTCMVSPSISPIFILPNEIIPVTRYVVPSFCDRSDPVPIVSSAAKWLQSVVLPQISDIFISTKFWHCSIMELSIFKYNPINIESKSSIEKFGLFALHTTRESIGQISWI